MKNIRTYVFTREPEEAWHRAAVDLLCLCPTVEVNFNTLLHAKFFVCECLPRSFALLATANLTSSGMSGYEVGILLEGRGGGEPIVDRLRDLALVTLRAFKETKRVKEISAARGAKA